MRVVVSTFGLLVALAGAEHGVGEILQGPVRPNGLVIESWPDSVAFAVLGGGPEAPSGSRRSTLLGLAKGGDPDRPGVPLCARSHAGVEKAKRAQRRIGSRP